MSPVNIKRAGAKAAALIGGAALLAFALAPASHHGQQTALKPAAATVPTPSHVVVVMEENHSYSDIIGDTSEAPYMNQLAGQGALMTNYYAITHPSDPNYLALFAGNTFGLTSDECPLNEGNTANLGSELLAAGDTFAGYSEDLPSAGSQTCSSGNYASKHSPWVNFSNIPAADQQPFSAFPSSSSDYANLPTVSWVIPNLQDDMHDGTITQADTWLNSNLSSYATWAQTHNSLLIVTWDEDDYSESNQVPTIIVGQGVNPGQYSEQVNHYNLLSTLEAMYNLPQAGASQGLSPISDVWSGSSTGGGNTVSVTNPGTQNATAGTAASLQLAATDSASGQTLTWSATGLPAGLSLNPSTGVISGTPTTAGTDDVIVTATDSSGSKGTAAFAYDVSPSSGADTVTVTNPGSQTGTVGTAASLQINATDSNSGESLAYSATGLPPGTSIGGADGTITGTPSTAGTYNVTVTADDPTGASASTSFTWTVDPATAGGCSSPGDVMQNSDFSSGATGWTTSSGVIGQWGSSGQAPYTGSYDAWLDGYAAPHTDTMSQKDAIPAGCTATLNVWLHIDSSQTTGTNGSFTVQVGGKTVGTFTNLDSANGYVEHSFDVSSDAGTTPTILFTGTENNSTNTDYVVGQVSLVTS